MYTNSSFVSMKQIVLPKECPASLKNNFYEKTTNSRLASWDLVIPKGPTTVNPSSWLITKTGPIVTKLAQNQRERKTLCKFEWVDSKHNFQQFRNILWQFIVLCTPTFREARIEAVGVGIFSAQWASVLPFETRKINIHNL